MLEHVEITVLSDNAVDSAFLLAEQGLSLHVATSEGEFLFDTGLEDVCIHNAQQVGIDLSRIEKIVFSHGHRDHTGGLYFYLKEFGSVPVVCHFNIFNRKFRVIEGGKIEVGIPHGKAELTRMGAEFVFQSHPYALSENILLSGVIRRLTAYEKFNERHQELVLESYITDKLNDDMTLILKTVRGLIILLGDAHSGPVNSVNDAVAKTGISEIFAIVGGMSLEYASEEKIAKIAEGLRRLNPQYLVPLHSTGFRARHYFYNIFRERLLLMSCGDRLTLKGVDRAARYLSADQSKKNQ